MIRFKKSMLSALMLASLGAVSIAGADSKLIIPKLLQDLQSEGGQIHKAFKVSEYLNGFAMSLGSEQVIIYSTTDGKHLFQGNLVDNDAKNLTEVFANQHLPKPDFSKAIPLFEEGSWFETHDTDADITLYVLHDPRCPYCTRSMDSIMERKHQKGVKVRWVPVAALGKDSLNLAAGLLGSKNPIKLQTDITNGHRLTDRESQAAEKHKQSVMDNSQLMRTIQASGTPAYMVVDEKAGVVKQIIHGFRPNDVNKIWP